MNVGRARERASDIERDREIRRHEGIERDKEIRRDRDLDNSLSNQYIFPLTIQKTIIQCGRGQSQMSLPHAIVCHRYRFYFINP